MHNLIRQAVRRTGVALLCVSILGVSVFIQPARAVAPFSGAVATAAGSVVINELMWMGSSVSSSDEWIELRNTTDQAVDIAGWRLTKFSSGQEQPMLTIPSGTIDPQGFFLVSNYGLGAQSRLAIAPSVIASAVSLSNSTLQIGLYDAAANLVDAAGDRGEPLAGSYTSGSVWDSMERKPGSNDGALAESWYPSSVPVNFLTDDKEKGTPGAANSNMPPVAAAGDDISGRVNVAVNFDGSDSSDPEGSSLTYAWDFGDGRSASGATTAHLFSQAGEFTVTLTVSDGQTEAEDSLLVTITAPDDPRQPFPLKLDQRDQPSQADSPDSTEPPATGTDPTVANEPSAAETPEAERQTSAAILLNEVLPDPSGRDETDEFIELVNSGDEPVSLAGWKLTDTKNGYELSGIIKPEAFVVIGRPQSKIALNNPGDKVFLVDPFGTTINGVEYGKSLPGQSFSRQDSSQQWAWAEPTPGTANLMATIPDTDDDTTEAAPAAKTAVSRSVSLNEARQLPLRTAVTVSGSVTALPGQLGETIFYVGDNQSGMQIYSSQADWPALALGDSIKVTGQVGRADGEAKVNIKSAGDIIIVSRGAEPPAPQVDRIGAGDAGRLVQVAGRLTGQQRQRLDIETSLSTVTAAVKASTGIDLGSIKPDDQLSITGIVQATSGGVRLLPRSPEDIMVSSANVPPAGPGADHSTVSAVPDQSATVVPANSESATNDSGERTTMIGLGVAVGLGIAGRLLWPRRQHMREWFHRRFATDSPPMK